MIYKKLLSGTVAVLLGIFLPVSSVFALGNDPSEDIAGSENFDELNVIIDGTPLDKGTDATPKDHAKGGQDGQAASWYGPSVVPGIFIRAPKIVSASKNVKILAKYKNEIVAVRQGKFLATNFHPELTDDVNIHQYFVKMCEE